MRSRISLVVSVLFLAGCYDLRGGVSGDSGAIDAGAIDAGPTDAGPTDASIDVPTLADAPTMDLPPPRDALDATSLGDASDGGDASPDGAADASDVGGEEAPADVVARTDVTDAVVDAGPPPCPSGQTRCGESCVDTSASPAHCGVCGMSCPARSNAAPTCVMGTCRIVCDPGFADCDGDAVNGCEADLGQATSCGACGTRCQGSTPLCQQRVCVSGCSGVASSRCGASCVDTQTSVEHCGACDRACTAPTNGRATCAAGACGIACDNGFHACGTGCADNTSVATCGSLCAPCPTRANATSTCSAGACGFTCHAGYADCDGDAANGCEAPLDRSPNCGLCGQSCSGSRG